MLLPGGLTTWADGQTVHGTDVNNIAQADTFLGGVFATQKTQRDTTLTVGQNFTMLESLEIDSGQALEIPATTTLEIIRYLISSDLVPSVPFQSSATTLTLPVANVSTIFTGAAAAVWTLPPVAGNTGRPLTLVNRGTSVVTVNRAGTDNIYGGIAGAITSYSLVVGTSVNLVNDGTYWTILSETQPWVTKWTSRNPGSHNVPQAFTSYYDKPATSYANLATNYPVFDTGQAITYSPGAGIPSQPVISGGALTLTRTTPTGAAAASYQNLDAGSGNTLTRIGVKLRFDNTGASTTGHAIAIAMSNAYGLNGNGTAYRMVHLNVTYNQWLISKVTNATGTLVFTTLASGFLQNNMEADNLSEYTVELWRVGNVLTGILPDGQRIVTPSDVDIGTWATQYGFFEPGMNVDTTDPIPGFTEVWYGINTQFPPGDSGLVRREDIVAERSYARTLSNVTLSSNVKMDLVSDTGNGHAVLLLQSDIAAVNYLQILGRNSGLPVYMAANGSDANIDLSINGNGTGIPYGLMAAPNVLAASKTILAGNSTYMPEFLEIASGFACEISTASVLEIG